MVGWKLTKFLMSHLKPEVSSFWSFASLFSVMKGNFYVLVKLKLYMIWRKGVYQSAEFQTSDWSREISPNLFFVLRKYITYQLNTYRGVMSHDTRQWCKIWRKTNLLFQKWQEFDEFWSEHSKFLTTCTLIGLFCAKYIMLDLKKHIGVIFHDTEEPCKI